MSDIKEAAIRTAAPLLIAVLAALAVSAAVFFIPTNILMVGSATSVLVYLIINLFRMNLDIVRSERTDEVE